MLVFWGSRVMLTAILPHAPHELKRFLRHLPLSIGVFLILVILWDVLVPMAGAKGTAAAPFSGMLIPLYALLFFLVAGLTNFVCNNFIAAEAEALERFFRPGSAGAPGKNGGHSWKRSRAVLCLFFLLYAMVGAHINANFSLLPTAEPGIALVAFLTIIVAAYAKDGPRFLLATHYYRFGTWLEANALGVLLALLSIWLTRTLHLAPGYLFGVPAGVFIASHLSDKHEGPFEWSGLLAMLSFAGVAWLLIPIASAAPVLQDFLKLLFVILLEACFFESLPFPYLAGASLYRWRRGVWALQCTVATFLVLHLLWNPGSTIGALVQSPPALTYVLLLGIYALAVCMILLYGRNVRSN